MVGSVGSAKEDVDDAIHVLSKLDISALTQHVFQLDQYAGAWNQFRTHKVLKALLAFDLEGKNCLRTKKSA